MRNLLEYRFSQNTVFKTISELLKKGAGLRVQEKTLRLLYLVLNCKCSPITNSSIIFFIECYIIWFLPPFIPIEPRLWQHQKIKSRPHHLGLDEIVICFIFTFLDCFIMSCILEHVTQFMNFFITMTVLTVEVWMYKLLPQLFFLITINTWTYLN